MEQKPSQTQPPTNHTMSYVAVVVIIALLGGLAYISYRTNTDSQSKSGFSLSDVLSNSSADANLQQFSSADDFKSYLSKTNGLVEDYYYSNFFSSRFEEGGDLADDFVLAAPGDVLGDAGLDTTTSVKPLSTDAYIEADRYSETNVQVSGIDEPDIVKTDGEHIFFSQPYSYFYDYTYDFPIDSIGDIPDYSGGVVDVINTLPVDALELVSQIDSDGNLLLQDDTLMVLTATGVAAYNMSNPATPESAWDITFDDAIYQTARLYGNTLYLVTSTYINQSDPCPYTPVTVAVGDKTTPVVIPCLDIYHPVELSPIDATYTVFKVNIADGSIAETVSVAGLETKSVIYMSAENLYITHIEREPVINIVHDFLSTDGSDLVSPEVKQRLAELKTYNLSIEAQEIELSNALEKYFWSLTDDEELTAQTDFQNRMGEYVKEHVYELEHTSITKLALDDFTVQASGQVPGVLLDQYSMDEYNGDLRVATTIGERAQNFYFGSYWFETTEASVNDLYVLNDKLEQRGMVTNLGVGERIYASRFMGDRGYMVTFRETDPFYVFDLSNPDEPKKVGELKIPGYSSYLHPLEENLIVGIGKEDSQVKVSLFDVSDPAQPKEVSKYMLKEYWSDILDTQHAFLQDAEHEVFFVPGSEGGYVFSYADQRLNLATAVKVYDTKRAVYVNDYLYVLGSSEMVVLDENTWERVGEIKL